eukprot:GHVL01032245.1.p1 GENE.GHVL01032245.1~~GHVL01032245.1.p1  ORF type:complete len:423 (+),score=65.94 GHVL01032245.1:285-1553(+)
MSTVEHHNVKNVDQCEDRTGNNNNSKSVNHLTTQKKLKHPNRNKAVTSSTTGPTSSRTWRGRSEKYGTDLTEEENNFSKLNIKCAEPTDVRSEIVGAAEEKKKSRDFSHAICDPGKGCVEAAVIKDIQTSDSDSTKNVADSVLEAGCWIRVREDCGVSSNGAPFKLKGKVAEVLTICNDDTLVVDVLTKLMKKQKNSKGIRKDIPKELCEVISSAGEHVDLEKKTNFEETCAIEVGRPIVFVFWDTESTGNGKMSKVKMIQIAACCSIFYQNDSGKWVICALDPTFTELVKINERVNKFIQQLTGITNERLERHGIPIDKTLDNYNDWLKSVKAHADETLKKMCIRPQSNVVMWVVAHNGYSFDDKLLCEEANRADKHPCIRWKLIEGVTSVDSLVVSRKNVVWKLRMKYIHNFIKAICRSG